MAEIKRMHAELVMENAECSRPRAEMDYSQVGLPRFIGQQGKSQPPHERMTKLEATMDELERVHIESATSPEPHEKTNDEVVKTIPEMTLWVAMHEKVKNEKKTLTSEVDEYVIHLYNELIGIIVKKKMKKIGKKMILEDCVLKLLIEHNYHLLEKDGG